LFDEGEEPAMDIGKPQRIHRVEPLKDPVPAREEPRKTPAAPAPKRPKTAPVK